MTDIAIVGGGMVGVSLALLLAHNLPDCHITLIEGRNLPKPKAGPYQSHFDARSTALSSSSLNIFRTLGLSAALQQGATWIEQVHVSDRGHMGALSISAADCHQECLGAVVENAYLGQTLGTQLQAFNNIQYLAPAQVTQIHLRRDGAQLTVHKAQQEHHLSCQLVVIADGATSPLRENMGIRTRTKDYRQQAVIANISHTKSHRGVAFERFTDRGPLALLPLGGCATSRRSALVWTHPTESAAEVEAWEDKLFLNKLQQRFGYRLGRLERVGQRQIYPLQLVVAEEQVRSSLVLMGNAAHFLHPLAGQGFNLALRDCAKLTQILQQARGSGQALGKLSVLQAYEHAQIKDQEVTILLSHNFNRLFSNSKPLAMAGRNVGLLGLGLLSPAKRIFAQQMMGFNTPAALKQRVG